MLAQGPSAACLTACMTMEQGAYKLVSASNRTAVPGPVTMYMMRYSSLAGAQGRCRFLRLPLQKLGHVAPHHAEVLANEATLQLSKLPGACLAVCHPVCNP